MKRIGYLPMLSDDAACYYRMTGVLNYIQHPELRFTNIHTTGAYSWASVAGMSAVILQRPSTAAHADLIRMIKDMGVKVISDWDDDMLNLDVHLNETISYDEMVRSVKLCLHLSDEIWAATPAIKKAYKPYNRNIHVIPNAHNDYIFPADQKKEFDPWGKLAAYRGGSSHQGDVSQNINDLVQVMERNTDWEFRFVGAGKPIDETEKEWRTQFGLLDNRTKHLKNHTFTMPATLIQFFRIYHDYNAQLAFFPLITSLFNKAKSNIFILESTYAGSAIMGNKNLPEFDFPFVTDISEGMYEPFMGVKGDTKRMKQMNEQAWEWICAERLLSNVNNLRIERLLSV